MPERVMSFATCECGVNLDTRVDADQHMNLTLEASGDERRSHSIKINVPTLAAALPVLNVVENAIDDAMRRLEWLIERDEVTEEQVVDALRSWPDFADAWDDREE